MGDELRGQGRKASGTYPTSPIGSAVIGDLLRGTIAAVRCREYLARGDDAAAHIELLLVRQSLEALEGREFDPSTTKRADLLREEETRLGRLFIRAVATGR